MIHLYLSVVGGTGVLLLIGYWEIIGDLRRLRERQSFNDVYLDKLDKSSLVMLHNKRNVDQGIVDDYTWLLENADAIQFETGANGILALYRAPYDSHYTPNYPLFINVLPDLRRGQAHPDTVGYCLDALVKHRGSLIRNATKIENERHSPASWLRRGVRYAVTMPLRLVLLSGLISDSTFLRIRNSGLITAFSGFVTLFGVVGTVFSIVSGWDSTVQFLRHVIRH